MDPTVQLIAVVISALAVFGAFAAWLVRHMDRRFDEAKADTQRQLDQARADTQRQLDEAKADTQRQLDEARADMHRRFDEAEANTHRRFGEAEANTHRRFGEAEANTHRRFDEAEADTQRRFAEVRADTQRGFDGMREDFRRLESKLDAQSEQMANLRQDVGRLQGIVERTYEPARFTLPSAQEEGVGGGVGEAPASYDTGAGGDDPARSDEP